MNLEPVDEDDGLSMVVVHSSDHSSESSDDSNDDKYIEEPWRLGERKRVKFSDTVSYTPDGLQQTSMLPANTVDNESQGSSPDTACISEETPVYRTLNLKEVDRKIN